MVSILSNSWIPWTEFLITAATIPAVIPTKTLMILKNWVSLRYFDRKRLMLDMKFFIYINTCDKVQIYQFNSDIS